METPETGADSYTLELARQIDEAAAAATCPRCAGTPRAVHAKNCPLRKGGRPKKPEPSDDLNPDVEIERSNVREICYEVFNRLGGLKGMTNWARKNPEKFYTNIFAKMGPRFEPGKAGRPLATRKPMTVELADDAPDSGEQP
jgi:hypothetical protein